MNGEEGKQTRLLEFTHKVMIAVGLTFAILAVLLIAWKVAQILMLVFAGILLAIFLRGLAGLLNRLTGLPNSWSLLAVLVLLTAAIVLAAWLVWPHVASQINQLTDQLPRAVGKLSERIRQYSWGRALLNQIPSMNELGDHMGTFYRQVTNLFRLTMGAAGSFLLILFVGLYLAYEPGLYITGLIRLVPLSYRPKAKEVIDELGHVLRWWLIGRFFSMAVIGVLTALGLWLIGIKLALTLGLFAAVLTFIPYIGPIVSAVPAILLGLLQGPLTAFYVVILYTAIQTIESYIATPLVQRTAVSLPPVFTLTVQIALSVLVGIVGLIVATPLGLAALVAVRMVYVENFLEQDRVKWIGTEGGAKPS
ncbi:MAG: AI-2E family transporter [Desulfobacteraceae bacterium]|nr:MAG: AI-2E family transporter [Desulfobacteraceae bacterium]